MAWFKKESSAPDYLKSEEAFKGSLSYEGRKQFIQNETRLGLSKYKGTTAENEQARRIIAENPDILARYEQARRGIIGDTRKSLGVLRTEGAMGRAIESSRANQKMVLGIAKDLNGRILEGGLFGVIFGGPKRQQWLTEIENEYPQARGKLLPLIEGGFENAAWDAAKSGNSRRFINFMKKIGRPLGAQDEARVRQIIAAPSTINDRQEAIVETLFVGAVSYVLTGGVGILLGKIRTPIPLHKSDLPSKEAITQSLHGEGAQEQAQAAHNEFWQESAQLRTTKGSIEKAKRIYGKEAAYVLAAIEEFGAQIDVNSNWVTSGVKKGRAKNLQRATEFGPWDTQKTLSSIRFRPGSPEEARRVSLLEKLNQIHIVRGLAESGSEGGYTQMLNMMNGCGSEEIFLNKYVLPSEVIYGPNVKYIRQAIHAFYHGGYAPYRDETKDVPSYKYQPGDQRIIYSLVHSKYTPGVVRMINSYQTNPEKWKTANDKTTGGGRNVREKTQAYSKDLLKNIDMRSPEAVSQVFRNDSVNGESIADIYSRNLLRIGNINITPNAIANAIKNGQYKHVNGQNTWRNQQNTGVKNFSGEALVFTVRESSGIYRVCAIKRDCTNLIIGEKIPSPENYLDNLPATVNFRLPLILTLKGGSGGKNNQKPNEPNNNPPQEPTEPHVRPEGPGTPHTPGQGSHPRGPGPTTDIPQNGGNDLPTSVQPTSPTTPVKPGHSSTPDVSGVSGGTGDNPLDLSGSPSE